MRNLLSQQDEKKVLKEYKLRIIIVVMAFVFFTMLIASALLLPSYIISNYRYNITQMNAKIIKDSIEKREQGESDSILNETQEKLKLLTVSESSVLLSEAFAKIISKKPVDVKVGEFVYNKKGINIGEIVVAGVANERESLLLFKRNLEKEAKLTQRMPGCFIGGALH